MKRKGLILLFSVFALMLAAQTTSEELKTLQVEVALYGQAVRKVVTEKHPQEGIDLIDGLIAKPESRATYVPERLASYYRLRSQAQLRLRKYAPAATDYRRAL